MFSCLDSFLIFKPEKFSFPFSSVFVYLTENNFAAAQSGKPKLLHFPVILFMKHIKPLDSLRAIAVFLVTVSHWFSARHVINKAPNGVIGVEVFFVLSGFLITRILLESRLKAEELSIGKIRALKNFFFRRALRIFPIYYLLIFTLFIFHDWTGTNIKPAFIYFVTYTSNFYFYHLKAWDGMISHFWTLAVEEQFYLLWPWIILFVNKKYLLPVILFFVATGICSQYLLREIEMGDILTISCFDAFGLGALLSWLTVFKPQALISFYKIIRLFALACLIIYFTGLYQQWVYIPLRTLVSVIALWIITYVVYMDKEEREIQFSFLLNNKLLLFIGKISYGMYLYHRILPSLTTEVLNRYLNNHFPLPEKYIVYVLFIENFTLLILIAWLSWKFIEAPLLKLKKYFTYRSVVHPGKEESLVVGN